MGLFKSLFCSHVFTAWYTPNRFFDFPAESYRECIKCKMVQQRTTYRTGGQSINQSIKTIKR